MKIVKTEPEFRPVSILLETQDELDMFTEVFFRVGGDKYLEVFGNTSKLFYALTDSGGKFTRNEKASGQIIIN